MTMKAYFATDAVYPEEAAGTVIASSDEEAMTAAMRMLNVERDGVTLYTAETAEGAIKGKLEELNDAMEKSARAERASITEELNDAMDRGARAEIMRITDALPVLQWRKMREGRLLGTLLDWKLDAYDDQFVVFLCGRDVGGGRATDLAAARASAEGQLRRIGVCFRVAQEVVE